MHVEDAGTGLPVLAIHGLGGGAHFFADFTRLMQPDYRVLSNRSARHRPQSRPAR